MPDELKRLVFFVIVLATAATLVAFGLHVIVDRPCSSQSQLQQPAASCNIADDDCINYCHASCMATPQPCLDSCIASCD
jgi:hypothetical protein